MLCSGYYSCSPARRTTAPNSPFFLLPLLSNMSIFFILLFIAIVLILLCTLNTTPRKQWKLVSSSNNTFVITPEPTPSAPVEPETFTLDYNDIQYYTNKYNVDLEFQRQLIERGLATTEEQEPVLGPVFGPIHPLVDTIENYIIDEIVGDLDTPLGILDTQNVHDTALQNSLERVYSVYKNNETTPGFIDIHSHARRLGKSESDIAKINRVVDKMKKRNSTVSKFSDTEINILQTIWDTNDQGIRDQVINALLDCEENGSVVCPTGTTSRIIEAVYIHNPENTPKTARCFKEEMLNKASAVRKNLEANPDFGKESDSDQSLILRKKLLDTFYNDYDGILSRQEILDQTAEWIDYV